MGKRRRRSRQDNGLPERFIIIDHHLLDSPAFAALSPEAVKLLLARDDVNPSWKDYGGLTALLVAKHWRQEKIVELLLAY